MPDATDPICTCTHPISKHDSGGCCREMFCPCSHLVIAPQPLADEQLVNGKAAE